MISARLIPTTAAIRKPMTASASVIMLLDRSSPVNSVASVATRDGGGRRSFPTPDTATNASHTTRTTTMTAMLTAIRRKRRRRTARLGPGASTTVGAVGAVVDIVLPR